MFKVQTVCESNSEFKLNLYYVIIYNNNKNFLDIRPGGGRRTSASCTLIRIRYD